MSYRSHLGRSICLALLMSLGLRPHVLAVGGGPAPAPISPRSAATGAWRSTTGATLALR